MSGHDSDRAHSSQTGIFRTIKAYIDRNRLGELLVGKGLITTEQLRFALTQQKQNSVPLGQIFLSHAMISHRQLAFVLGRQTMLRVLAGFLLFTVSLTQAEKKAHAEIKDVPAKISISASSEFGRVSAYPALFGSDEKRSANLSPFTKWVGMFDRFDRELKSSAGDEVIGQWQKRLGSFKGLSMKTTAAKVNSLVNETRYILDSKNWGQSDYWATPVEFLQRGGDCEDYAIAKYTALRALGFPEERLRVAIVHDKQKNIPHAVLVVYTDEGTYILDNQNTSMLDGDRPGRYRPIYSINRQAWWLHTAPGATVVASAR